jgi:hypothetical protein
VGPNYSDAAQDELTGGSVFCLLLGCHVDYDPLSGDLTIQGPTTGEWAQSEASNIPFPAAVKMVPLEEVLSKLEPDVSAAIEERIAAASEAQAAVGEELQKGKPTWGANPTCSILTQSGTNPHPMTTQGTSAAMELANEMGYTFPEAGFQDNGVPGSYFASHAETQLAALAPNEPIGVSRPMCPHCQKFFTALAAYWNEIQVVVDPQAIRVFFPGGIVGVRWR